MDKLRALNYFVAAADAGSFAGAARLLDVSVPAVHKLVAALESQLGVALFERSARGLALTSSGAAYLDSCRPLLDDLAAADDAIGRASQQVSGNLIVGAHSQIVHRLLLPALPRFRARYPDVQFDLRIVTRPGDPDAAGADVLLLQGWPDADDYVLRSFGLERTFIAAAPAYWAARGVPAHPSELADHACLLLRNPAGIVLDLWEFERGGQTVAVKVGGWLRSNNGQVLLDAVLGGEGVSRFNEVSTRSHVQSGALVPVLLEWEFKGGAPFNLLYRPNLRRTPRVRVFIDFMASLMRTLARDDDPRAATLASTTVERPHWHRRGATRASAALHSRR